MSFTRLSVALGALNVGGGEAGGPLHAVKECSTCRKWVREKSTSLLFSLNGILSFCVG